MGTSSVPGCSSPSACRSISTRGSKSRWPRSARSASTVRASACSPSTSGHVCPEAGKGRFGRGDPTKPGAVRGREEVRRAGLAGKEQAVVDRSGEHCAVVCVARKGKGIGAPRPGILLPGGGGEWRHPLADVVAEQAGELAGSEGEHCRLPFPL